MILRELLTVFGFDVDGKGAQDADRQFGVLKRAAVGVASAAVLATAALTGIVLEAAKVGNTAKSTGVSLGLTAVEVQKLGFAAESTGATFQQMRVGILKLQQKADEARRGNKEYAKTFGRLGISINDSSGKMKEALPLLFDTARAISKLPSAGAAAAASMKLFEEGGAALIPFLRQGEDGAGKLFDRMEQLGAVMSNETAAKAAELTGAMGDLSTATLGVRLRFAKELLPTALQIVTVLTDLLVVNRELIDRGLRRLGSAVTRVTSILGRLAFWAVRNRRFFAIFGSLLAVFFAAKVIRAARAMGILRLSMIKTLLTIAAPLAFLGLLALVMEDLATGAKGLRDLDTFLNMKARDPNAHPAVKVLAKISSLAITAIDAVDRLFAKLFGVQKVETQTPEETASLLRAANRREARGGGRPPVSRDEPRSFRQLLREAGERSQRGEPTGRVQTLLRDVGTRVALEKLGRIDPSVPIGPTQTITIPEVNITVNAPGATASDIKAPVKEAAEQGLERALRSADREFKAKVVK